MNRLHNRNTLVGNCTADDIDVIQQQGNRRLFLTYVVYRLASCCNVNIGTTAVNASPQQTHTSEDKDFQIRVVAVTF
jgi:hypothetical protein